MWYPKTSLMKTNTLTSALSLASQLQAQGLLTTLTVLEKSVGLPCKCNQDLIVGFGDNDHMIRGLMRFIEMTSR
jgi:hypothetical protein